MATAMLLVFLVAGSVAYYDYSSGSPEFGTIFGLIALAPPTIWFVLLVPAGYRKFILVGVAGIMALLLGYAAYWTVFAPKQHVGDVRQLADLQQACAGRMARQFYPQTSAYRGARPHPVALFIEDSTDTMVRPDKLPADRATEWSGDDLNPRNVQLVACMDRDDDGSFLADCPMGDRSVPLFQASYLVTIFESATGHEIGHDRLAGNPQATCPKFSLSYSKNPKIFAQPLFSEYTRILSRYVEQ
ncbi:hypothetical protein [Nocardia stercoris]|uniref:Uncharacterized protein n=1 Tax=Nocardia stercoris TaxID=2483361 RepID=A0A3M2L3K9_9NOCA|nr:hypothetical protein [Nocardia stercoris]RMI32292.1 hypothetical protein EBN03_15020 [Nocardia stercoris]